VTPWLAVVGVGVDGLASLGEQARRLVEQAELLVGSERLLALLPQDGRARLHWRTPLVDTLPAIAAHRGQKVCILATGDPFCHGIGTTLCRTFSIGEMHVIPAPSAFSLACARLGWSREAVDTLSLHGRPFALIRPHLMSGNRILCLSHDGSTPGRIAAELTRRGLGDSRVQVFERMGGSDESRLAGTAASWPGFEVAGFNTVAVECVGTPTDPAASRVPGLPDTAFSHDGQVTKREIRAVTLALLAPAPGHLLWDIGAGCGSVAIEWLRSDARCRAIAVEEAPERCSLIRDNADVLGCPGLEVLAGRAPAVLVGRTDQVDAIFVGGGLASSDSDGGDLLSVLWRHLKLGGRLVANVVTLESEARLQRWQTEHGGNLTRLQVARAEPVGSFRGWRPLMPVTIYSVVKTI